ncbi:MAG: MFS transporter [Patescibacteria group bacterium]|nr:MFS transporter [Patescibacteria group bacterium]
MKRQIKEHFIAATMVNFALAMVMLFEPIYLYQQGYSLQEIMFFYLIVYVIYFFLMPLGAHFARQKGEEPGIFVGSFLFIIFYISLFFITYHPWLFYISAIIYAFQKTYYWPAYHGNFAKFSKDAGEGKEISLMTAAASLVYIIGPVSAGFIIHQWGYGVLFVVVSLIFLTSNIATLITKEKISPANFPYLRTYKYLFSKENRRSFWAYIGFGEEVVVLIIWPIFISIIVADALNIGFIVTLATLVTTIAVLYIGQITDSKNKSKILSLGSMVYSLSWFFRLFIATGAGVFFVDTLSRLGKNIIGIPLMAITYEKAKEMERFGSSSVMNRVVFFELSLVVGKIIALAAIYSMLFFIGDQLLAFKATFIIAGAMTLLYMLL